MTNLSLAAKIFQPLETSTSIGMFARDTGGCLVPKLAVSRSIDEARELTFVEASESAIFYFSITPIAMMFSALASKLLDVKPEQLAKTIENINQTPKNLKLAKFGKIAATFSILLPLIYGIAPARNLITLSKTAKEDFVSVINLKNESNGKQNKLKIKKEADLKAKKEAKNLLTKLAGIATGGLALTFGIIKAAKNPAIFKKLEPLLNKTVKHFDFEGNAGLSLKQLGFLIMPVSIGSYFAACRDRFEVLENIQRFCITIPMMFFGQDIVEKNIYKFFDKKWGSTLALNKGISTYKEILEMPVAKQIVNLKSKNWAIASAFLINTSAIALAVGILNRISTKRRYLAQQKTNCSNKHNNDIIQWQNHLKQTRIRLGNS
ncbi:MAG: hypothetical protein AB7V50_07670 [Vampirovibrionia bacterium]